MSFLSQLSGVVTGRAKRLGRGYGSGKGAKSGRGTTRHQKARTDIPLFFEGGQGRLVKKYPLLRGKGKNKSHRVDALPVAVEKLEGLRDNDVVTVARLIEVGVLSPSDAGRSVKIVGTGALTKKVQVQVPVTTSARTIIEKAGGAVVTHASRNR